jgi:hypothetical protein
MATNVSEKDKTLREIIDYCKAKSKEEQDYARGAFDNIVRSWLSIALPPSKKIIVHSDYGDFSCAYAQYPNGNDIIRYCDKIEDTK